MNKRILFGIVMVVIFGKMSFGQVADPTDWKSEFSKENISIGDEIDVIFKTTIEKDWILYSAENKPSLPLVMEFDFDDDSSFELIGDVKYSGYKTGIDKNFNCEVTYYENTAEIRQTIKVKKLPIDFEGEIKYVIYSYKTGQLNNGEYEFELSH